MSLTGVLRAYWYQAVRAWTIWRLCNSPPGLSLERSNWTQSLQDATKFYLTCVRHFYVELPAEFRQHRTYFRSGRRGFGEDAFHVMWKLLYQEFRPASFLEIGVFRGQVISLASLCSRLNGAPCEVWGISPFSDAGDSTTSYQRGLDYYEDVLLNFDQLHLPRPKLLRAASTDREALDLIGSRSWDMIYIDGNHDYDVVLKDWDACSRNLKTGGIIVLDDAGLTTAYRAPVFATRGHPGPSRVAQEIDRSQFREILQVGHNRVFQRLV